MVGSELTLTSPNPPTPTPVLPDPFSSCSLSLESFLQIDSPQQFFSNLGQAAPVLGLEGQQQEQAALRSPSSGARAHRVEVALGGPGSSPAPFPHFQSLRYLFPQSIPSAILPRPNYVNVFGFSVSPWSQRSVLEAQPLGVLQRLPERFISFQ